MKGKAVFPFLTLSDADLQVGKWQIFLDDRGPLAETDHVPNWDYLAPLRIQRRIELDPEHAAQRLAIPASSLRIEMVVRIGTGLGTLPRTATKLTYPIPSRFVEIDHTITSATLSRRLKLTTELVLTEAPDKCGPLSPKIPGSRLWSDAIDYRLEGLEPRFPMEAVQFNEQFGIAAGALWYLHWNPLELDRDFHGGVRVYLNADHPEFIERINSGDRETLQLLLGGVISQMTERVLVEPGSDEFLQGATPGSIAWHVRAWLTNAFPNMPFELMRSTLEQRPGKFHATIQSLADVVGDQQ